MLPKRLKNAHPSARAESSATVGSAKDSPSRRDRPFRDHSSLSPSEESGLSSPDRGNAPSERPPQAKNDRPFTVGASRSARLAMRALPQQQAPEPAPLEPLPERNPILLAPFTPGSLVCSFPSTPPFVSSERLGSSLINRSSVPPFIVTRKENKSNYVSLALLQTNEQFNEAREAFPNLSLTGTFVGIGFGASFLCLRNFFSEKMNLALLCEREPYAYLLGKIFLSLIRTEPDPESVMLCLLNLELFSERYQSLVWTESDDSPIFLRHSREELLSSIPYPINYLRMQIFLGESHRATEEEVAIFDEPSSHPAFLSMQQTWLRTAWPKRMQYIGKVFFRVFNEEFAFLKSISDRIVPLCVDVFDPSFWSCIAQERSLWQSPSMFYFSNAAVYSVGSEKRGTLTSTTCGYDETAVKQLAERHGIDLYFAYTRKVGTYRLALTKEIPTRAELTESFNQR